MAVYTASQIYGFARQAGFSPDQAVTMTAVALAESGGNSGAHNPVGEDSRGLWQINMRAHSDWASSLDLYDPLDNARAAYRVSQGGADISPWTVTHGGQGAKYLAHRAEAQSAAVLNGDAPGLGVWTGTPGYGNRVAAGDGDGNGPFMMQAAESDTSTVQTFLDAALAQTGDEYRLGAEADLNDPDPGVFDCSELVEWAAHQVGVEITDGSWLQYLELKEQGAVIPVEEAINTPGALLFSFSHEPTPGGARPSQAHVAISLGDGQTIEARGRQYGVNSFGAEGRFQYAAVIPGLEGSFTPGTELDTARYLDAEQIDTDTDGLIDALEEDLGLDPTNVDTDNDELSDSYELLQLGTDPTSADTDQDRIADSVELAMGTDPLDPDSDRDGRLDSAPGRPEAFVDEDADQLADELEQVIGTDPMRIDSDGDGISDGMEYFAGFDPLDPMSAPPMSGDEPNPAETPPVDGPVLASDESNDDLG